jgi:hypothetical protein
MFGATSSIGLRSPVEVSACTTARMPSAATFATAASIPDVPVPETARFSAIGVEYPGETIADLVEDAEHLGIQVAHDRERHRAHHTCVDGARPWSEKQPLGNDHSFTVADG